MNTKELFEIARRVYPGTLISDDLDGNIAMFKEIDGVITGYGVFNPSLTGEDWQQAQACRVIVAAWENHYRKHPIMHNDHWVTLRGFPTTGGRTDILSAACAALLSQEGR